ncbi:hypothetical protein LEP48_05730 [Isoptericola sp. NEAU-Y5]|uniref:Uncharacterized protein n=1 Tax=Isoptericola luteus TaxID=2879484 RepID=A0ABS7ZGX9_9MICO|nr:hypothetical protein [Isoptericola sp. NEAU-Y5]MCA5892854.1 hypothetical protein [Isoptericola sp. NEAU-Y5]
MTSTDNSTTHTGTGTGTGTDTGATEPVAAGAAGVRPSLGAVLDAHARGYAQAVRLHLADLGPDVVEDLTDGLEADLVDALADATAPLETAVGRAPQDDVTLDLGTHFGPADAYAAELRAAAGLPPRVLSDGRRRSRRTLAARGARLAERWQRAWSPVTSTPQWERLRGLGRDVRPFWWVARGWIVGAFLVTVLGGGRPSVVPEGAGELLVMALGALVSVQWARGRWIPGSWQPRATVAASVVAVLLVPAVAGTTYRESVAGADPWSGGGSYDAGYAAGRDDARNVAYGDSWGEDGVWVDGMQVSNLFVYDANGDPIKDVQVFDDRGRAVRTVTDGGGEQAWAVPDVQGSWYFRPMTADDGRDRWNVYPLRAVPEGGMEWSDDTGLWAPQVGVQPEAMPWPFLKAPTSFTSGGAASSDPSSDPSSEPSSKPTDESKETPKDEPEETAKGTSTDESSAGSSPERDGGSGASTAPSSKDVAPGARTTATAVEPAG